MKNIKKIKKRDGSIQKFDPQKITKAIWSAAQAVGGTNKDLSKSLTKKVVRKLEDKTDKGQVPNVETVQDIVEKELVESGHYKTAKAYILYRFQHTQLREFDETLSDTSLIDNYIREKDWRIKENSNMSYSLQGLNVYIADKVVKKYWLEKIYPPEVRKEHNNSFLHIHDLGTLGVYCLGWDLEDILLSGFKGVRGKIESAPAKHFNVALLQVVNYIYTLQGESAGAQALSNFDTLLAPFIRYDNLSYKEAKQCMQEFLYNMNVPTRVGFQSPFSNVTMDLKVPSYLKDQSVIIGGKPQDETYGDFQKEVDMLNRIFAELMLDGDAKDRPFTFPIPTYNITKDFEWDNKTLDPLWEMTAKYGTPYFSNFINSDMKPEDARSMCCRLRLDNKELRKRGGGLFGSNPLTGCYDERTEVLTENGWKLFKNVNKHEKVFTLSDNNEIELHKPSKYFEYDYNGDMYRFKARSFDLLVTPNHKMVVDSGKDKKRKFVQAQNYSPSNSLIPKGGKWKGKEKSQFVLPPVKLMKGRGPKTKFVSKELALARSMRKRGNTFEKISQELNCSPASILNICRNKDYGQGGVQIKEITPELKIDIDNWLKFFGIWLAEGCTDNENIALNHGYRVAITQKNKKIKKQIRKLLNKLPFHFYEEKNGGCVDFIICSKQLWTYLRQFGDTYEKFIPKEIKNLSKRQLKILFDWMVKGDGYVRKTTGQINYWTASKKLANDVQEIVLKLGWMATSKKRIRETKIKGRAIHSNKTYVLGIQQSNYYRLRKNNISKQKYNGKVYCLEVPNHTLLVRRNGKVTWSGNSIGVVTLNMPRIAYLSDNEKQFFNRVEDLMEKAKKSLLIKREFLENLTEKGMYPYSKFYLRKIKKSQGQYWKNHFSTIGLIGVNDALMNLKDTNIGTKKGSKFAEKILVFMRDKLGDFQKETGDIFNLEATPAEGSSYRLARNDKKEFDDIKIYNIDVLGKEEPVYTNSTQLPFGLTDDIFEALDLQDPLQEKYTGGTTFHTWLGEKMPSIKATKNLVKKIANNYSLPYYTLTPTFSICPIHGYINGEEKYCPKCKDQGKTTKCEVYSRVVGYLRPVEQWNKGKQEEFKDRANFFKSAK